MDSFTILMSLLHMKNHFQQKAWYQEILDYYTYSRGPGELFSTGFTTLRRLSRTQGAGGVVGILVLVGRSGIVEDRIFKRPSLGF